MSYRVPAFPIRANIWSFFDPTAGLPPPYRLQTPAQLRLIKSVFGSPAVLSRSSGLLLLTPRQTDIRPQYGWATGPGDVVEVPAFSGRYYTVTWVDDVSKGFQTEYRAAVLVQLYLAIPYPIP